MTDSTFIPRTRQLTPVLLLVALLAVLFTACSSDSAHPATQPRDKTTDPNTETVKFEAPQDDVNSLEYTRSFEPDYNRLTPQPSVEPVTPNERDTSDVYPDRIEFPLPGNESVLTWQVGRVVVSAPGMGAGKNAFGFARRVVSFDAQATKVIAYTTPVSLDEILQGDVQQAIDLDTAVPVDLTKVDPAWAAENLYQNDADIVNMPGEMLTDDDDASLPGEDVALPDDGAVQPASSGTLHPAGFFGDLWKGVKGAAKSVASSATTIVNSATKVTQQIANKVVTTAVAVAKTVATTAKNVWVRVTPASVSGSVNLSANIKLENKNNLFSMQYKKHFQTKKGLAVDAFVRGSGSYDALVEFDPGVQFGAKLTTPGHDGTSKYWLNIDSKFHSKLGMDVILEAGVASAGGQDGSALDALIDQGTDAAQDAVNSTRERLFGDKDMKPAGGWKKTLYISKPSTKTFLAGTVPVVITLTGQLDLECGFEAKAAIKTHMLLDQNAGVKFTVMSEGGKTTFTGPTFTSKKAKELTLTGEGALEVSCGLIPRVNVFAYDTIGLFAGIRASLVARATYASKCDRNPLRSTPRAEIDMGLFGNIGIQGGVRVQAPGSSYAGKAGQKLGTDFGPLEFWNTEFPLYQKTFNLASGLGYCTPTCSNGSLDPNETDIDCGGPCGACAIGKKCTKNSECSGSVCSGGICGKDTCADKVTDGSETGPDCGGGTCIACRVGIGCRAASDCVSGFCSKATLTDPPVCVADSCSDGIKSGNEGGIDCGGSCKKCAVGQAASKEADCVSGFFNGFLCMASACEDRIKSPGESGVDCGGICAAKCGAGVSCSSDLDCSNVAPTCTPDQKICGKGKPASFAIAAGQGHTLYLKPDGSVLGWGSNASGQLGNNSTTASPTAVAVQQLGGAPLTGVGRIAANAQDSAAVKTDGTVWTWGSNTTGQLGDGTSVSRSGAVQVNLVGAGALTGVSDVAVGAQHMVARKSDGTVWAWGGNSSKQLGDGTTIARNGAVAVLTAANTPLTGVIRVAVGQTHSLALKNDGTVWAWGAGAQGQLGNAASFDSAFAVQVVGLTNVVEIGAGGTPISTALKGDGSVWTWGSNRYALLASGKDASVLAFSNVPVQALFAEGVPVAGVVHLATNYSDVYVILNDGTVRGWGDSSLGQRGDGTTGSRFCNTSPLVAKCYPSAIITANQSVSLANIVGIVTTYDHAIAIDSSGHLFSWGQNGNAQLGNASAPNVAGSAYPVTLVL